MTPDRSDRARQLCERLTADVAVLTPPGIGHWDQTWETVGDADAEFMVALSGWQSDPTPEALATVTAAYDAVLAAWGNAVLRFHEHVEDPA